MFQELSIGEVFTYTGMEYVKLPLVTKLEDLKEYNAFCLDTKCLTMFAEEAIVNV